MQPTIVHVCRHGQVQNPDHILYGRLPGYGLSELGRAMAERLGERFADVPLDHLRVSPLQRAKETLAPIAANHPHLPIVEEPRVIEAANAFEGREFGRFNQKLLLPTNWWYLRNPLRPSWGEPYREIAVRMRAAIADMAASVPAGGQALVVAHQLPIYIARLDAEGRSFVHNPANRECRLASVTSFHVLDGRVVKVTYEEPCADLYPTNTKLFRPGM
ncbi:MAG: histidine phosphatase family protein [Propioniciclava sp.]|uniref:histidine phosphatase family protein n=1 Tax=Propioniciclava sp. TaxID=2038686 RepID=UPI0039E7262C